MTRKKSILEKWGLVEKNEEFNQDELIESLQLQSKEIEEEVSFIQTPQVTLTFGESEDFLTVQEAYEKAGVSDLSESIFKAEEFSSHLPDNFPSDVKRQTVIGLLGASGLEVNQLIEDGNGRISVLKEVSLVTNEMSDSIVEEKEQEIAELLNKIDSLKQDILDRKTSQEKQDNLIDEELNKISQILKFISPKQKEETQ